MYLLLLAVIYLAFISLGLPDSLLGSGWPIMHSFFGVSLSSMGIVTMIISGCTIISSLMSERVTKRFGTSGVTLFCVTLTAVALMGFSVSTHFWMICLWGIPYGLGAGSIDAALNNYIAVHYSSKHMSWLHCFWGVGTIISPYVMSFALIHYNWQTGYRIISVVQFIIAGIILFTLPLWKINKKSSPAELKNSDDTKDKDKKILGITGALKIKGVPCLLIGFMCYCSAESTCMYWIASYLIETKGVIKEDAAAFAALFFIGITAGRFLAGFISDILGDKKMIRLGTGIIVLGIVMIAIPGLPVIISLAGCVVIGVGCAPVYPCIIHSTPSNFGAENSQAIIGVQMASAYTGTTIMPPIVGAAAGILGMWILPVFLIIFVASMTIMIEKMNKNGKGD